MVRECIKFDVLGAGLVGDGEVKPSKTQSPPSLVRINSTRGTEIRKVFMVCPLLDDKNDSEEIHYHQ